MGGLGLLHAAQQPAAPAAITGKYVDYEGWILTAEEKVKLLASAKFKRLDNTNLPGQDMGSHPVADEASCAVWCLMESKCQSFAFAKPDPPGRGRPSMCWIKSSVPSAIPSNQFISGIVSR
jgi:hypothetical protein